MAAEQGLSVDEDGFRRLMKEQRDRAKADAKAKKTGHADLGAYREIADTRRRDRLHRLRPTPRASPPSSASSSTASPRPAATEGDEVEVVLDRTPFYAEGGGQIADTGRIKLDTGAVIEVRDVPEAGPGRVRPQGRRPGRRGHRRRHGPRRHRRRAAARPSPAPTRATHLTHQALRDALGPTAAQAGSENSARPLPLRLRLARPPSRRPVLTDVEQKINEVLARELDVHAEVMSIDEAKKQGAIAEFGEKYGERVRVVTIGDFSKELCGGTHVHNTAQLGLVKLLGESSIGSGVRRIEALVGVDAYNFLAREHTVVAQLQELVKGRPEELPEKISAMLGKLKDAEKEIEKFRAEKVLAGRRRSRRVRQGRTRRRPGHRPGPGRHRRRRPAQAGPRRARPHPGRPARRRRPVHRRRTARPLTVIATNEAARERGLKAGDLVRTAAKTLGGGGGGKPDVAQGGGQNPAAVGEAVDAVERLVAETAK